MMFSCHIDQIDKGINQLKPEQKNGSIPKIPDFAIFCNTPQGKKFIFHPFQNTYSCVFLRNGVNNSIGNGIMVLVLRSPEISLIVCR